MRSLTLCSGAEVAGRAPDVHLVADELHRWGVGHRIRCGVRHPLADLFFLLDRNGYGRVQRAQLAPRDRSDQLAHSDGLRLELDVQLTGDGVLVVQHDDTVDKTTEASGPVDELTLDEIQELAPEVQAKVLRALEQGVVTRVGGSKPIEVLLNRRKPPAVILSDRS